ncbi:MAG: S8/S53 family peptidase [Chloroflexi bacterium]|nr:S8/S53 family peptidase [Chloroflexota bacterium]
MRMKVFFLFCLMLLVLAAALPATMQQQSQGQIEETPGDVAILVVDVFEPGSEVALARPGGMPNSRNAPRSFDGMDGFIIQGNASISSDLYPFRLTHGDLVFQHLEFVLNSRHKSVLSPSILPHAVKRWESAGGQSIWLAAVDTNQYEIGAIVSNVIAAIRALQAEGVERFVINMSFGLVPCNTMPVVNEDTYLVLLDEMEIVCPEGSPTPGLEEIRCWIEQDGLGDGYRANVTAYRDDTGGETAAAYAYLQLLALRPLVAQALADAVANTPGGIPADESLIEPFVDSIQGQLGEVSDVELILVASAGNSGLDYPFYPAIHPDVLSVHASYNFSELSMCSQWTQDSGAISEYLELLGFPVGSKESNQLVDYLLVRPANWGEVSENGATGIRASQFLQDPRWWLTLTETESQTWTKFSAVHLEPPSRRHASACIWRKYLARDGPACEGNLGLFDPPFAHREWSRLPLGTRGISARINTWQALKDDFCAAFPG